jgi:hypothetical protein
VLVWGGTEYPWGSPTILWLGIIGTALVIMFLWWETRTPEPILPLRLFRNSIFTVCSALGFLSGCAMFGGIVFLPLFLQVATGASATNSGLLLLPLMAGLMTASIGSGMIITRTGRYKVWPIGGMIVAIIGTYLLSRMTAETGRIESSVYMIILGIGIGMAMQVLVLAVQNALPPSDLGVATSAVTFFRSMGGSFGVALFGAILNGRISAELPRLVPAAALAAVHGETSRLLSSPEQIRSLPLPVARGIIEALVRGVQSVFIWSIPLLVAGLAIAWLLEEIPLKDTAHVGASFETAGEELAVTFETGVDPEHPPSLVD